MEFSAAQRQSLWSLLTETVREGNNLTRLGIKVMLLPKIQAALLKEWRTFVTVYLNGLAGAPGDEGFFVPQLTDAKKAQLQVVAKQLFTETPKYKGTLEAETSLVKTDARIMDALAGHLDDLLRHRHSTFGTVFAKEAERFHSSVIIEVITLFVLMSLRKDDGLTSDMVKWLDTKRTKNGAVKGLIPCTQTLLKTFKLRFYEAEDALAKLALHLWKDGRSFSACAGLLTSQLEGIQKRLLFFSYPHLEWLRSHVPCTSTLPRDFKIAVTRKVSQLLSCDPLATGPLLSVAVAEARATQFLNHEPPHEPSLGDVIKILRGEASAQQVAQPGSIIDTDLDKMISEIDNGSAAESASEPALSVRPLHRQKMLDDLLSICMEEISADEVDPDEALNNLLKNELGSAESGRLAATIKSNSDKVDLYVAALEELRKVHPFAQGKFQQPSLWLKKIAAQRRQLESDAHPDP